MANELLHHATVEIAAYSKNGLGTDSVIVTQFERGSSMITLHTAGLEASMHCDHRELRQIAAQMIAAADAFDASVAQQVSA